MGFFVDFGIFRLVFGSVVLFVGFGGVEVFFVFVCKEDISVELLFRSWLIWDTLGVGYRFDKIAFDKWESFLYG